jgi:hypothetical protein
MALEARTATVKTDYGSEQAAMDAYLRAGEKRALALGNRGPIRFNPDGSLAKEILDAYWRCGFYVFTGVLEQDELQDIESDISEMLERAPIDENALVDAAGRPALGADCEAPTLFWARPLSDPFGGTDLANGRHPARMFEPTPAADAPKKVIYLVLGSLQFSDACLRVYGHPQLLGVAAGIHGADFTPFNEALFIKQPGLGSSVAWHQDGVRIGIARILTKARMASILWRNFMDRRPRMAYGSCRERISTEKSISRRWSTLQVAIDCRMLCPCCARQATSGFRIGKPCMGRSRIRVATRA